MKLKNDFKNIAGNYEALGLDLFDILQMVNNPKIVETEINELKKSLDNALNAKNDMLKKNLVFNQKRNN